MRNLCRSRSEASAKFMHGRLPKCQALVLLTYIVADLLVHFVVGNNWACSPSSFHWSPLRYLLQILAHSFSCQIISFSFPTSWARGVWSTWWSAPASPASHPHHYCWRLWEMNMGFKLCLGFQLILTGSSSPVLSCSTPTFFFSATCATNFNTISKCKSSSLP